MPPKKNTKTSKAPAAKGNGKEGEKGGDKTDKKKDIKRAPKCRRPLASGMAMTQRRLPPTICCPAPGTAVRCCLPRPGCWPY